ncbi:ROK family protein [Aquidulcibacter paucihalophilus]|nr:ROK family protein [Aquidulcibacter paucihalophilus]
MNHSAKAVPLKVGIELGGTKCVMMLGTGLDDIRSEARIETVGPHRTMDAIDARLRQWSERHGFDAVGVASFGPLDLDPRSPTYGCVVNTPKPGWSGFDLLGPLRCWAVPVGFDTDVNGSALAEGRWGAAQGLASFAYVTVGTGIGVGSIIDGRSVRGLGHSEAGHLRIPSPPGSTFAGVCPFHGDCVEGLASGPAVLAHAGVPAEQLSTTDAAWEVVVSALAALCHNLVLTTAPERILLGGGLGMGQPHLLPRIRATLLASLNGYGVADRIAAVIDDFIVQPGLGHSAGPLGALALAIDAGEAASR